MILVVSSAAYVSAQTADDSAMEQGTVKEVMTDDNVMSSDGSMVDTSSTTDDVMASSSDVMTDEESDGLMVDGDDAEGTSDGSWGGITWTIIVIVVLVIIGLIMKGKRRSTPEQMM